MSCVLNHINPPAFHDNLGPLARVPHLPRHQLPPFPQETFVNGKSPRLISASWETLERLPRMSPPTSESITTHLLSNSSPSTSYLDSVLYKVICTPQFLKSAKENYIQPMLDTEFNQIVLPVECGQNCAFMYLTRLCQGSKGPCILFNTCYWLTPNEFQSISGRNSAKDWKRSIRHNGKSIKLLINKGILTVHSPLCDCAYGSGIEPFVEKYTPSPPNIASPNLDVREPTFGNMDSECSHSEGNGGSEDDPDQDEKISSCTSDVYGAEHLNEGKVALDIKIAVDMAAEETDQSEAHVASSQPAISRLSHFTPIFRSSLSAASDNPGEEPSSLALSNSSKTTSNGDREGSMALSTGHKSKRKPSTKQVHQHKPSAEQQSPTHLSSTTSSPPMTPPPLPPPSSSQSTPPGGGQSHGNSNTNNNHNSSNNNSSGGSSPPQQPIKQMEQMMTASTRNYSEFMRSLAAKYNHQQSNHNNDYFPNLSFDTRFLKPAAAAAFLNLSQLPSPVLLDKEKFPLIDMSSTQTLLSMVRSASAAAAFAAASNNNNNNNQTNNNNNDCYKSSGGATKRPNSPLDLSSRDMPPTKKAKLKSFGVDLAGTKPSTAGAICMSLCASGCSEEAQAINNWSVEEVYQFVSTIDLCKDYAEVFREHSIDGSALPLLTEEHLMSALNMKLGPALKFRSTVAKRLGNCAACSHCTHCHNHNNN